MPMINAILSCILFLLTVIMAFTAINNSRPLVSGLIVLCCITSFGLCYFCLPRQQVINTNTTNLKIINVSYECPKCSRYISGLDTKFCPGCGHDVSFVKGEINGKGKY